MISGRDREALLAIDVGTANTRAILFDVVDGSYRMVASGQAPSTVEPPVVDAREGIRRAMDQLHAVTGRLLVDLSGNLIMPLTSDGEGIDAFVATSSAGPSVRCVLAGLMPLVSLDSGRRLASASYLDVVAEIGLQEGNLEEQRLDTILSAKPDLILIVGGTDGGASQGVLSIVDTVRLALELLPDEQRPHVVYAGNRELAPLVEDRLGGWQTLTISPNVRPGVDQEDMAGARLRLAQVVSSLRSSRDLGFDELWQWSNDQITPTGDAFGRLIRYLSLVHDPSKAVLGVDLGAGHLSMAAASGGELGLSVYSDIGLGAPIHRVLLRSGIEKVMRWLPVEMSHRQAQNYVLNKALHPNTVPVDMDELHLEYAITRQALRIGLKDSRDGWPSSLSSFAETGILPPTDPILASGSIFSSAPHPGYAMLALLDALQPWGVTTLVLDPHSMAPALGAASGVMPLLPIQVLESRSFVSLGTVVAPLGRARAGRTVLRLRLERQAAADIEEVVHAGDLLVLPLKVGEEGQLTLRPERGFDLGFGRPGKGGRLTVSGGAVGLIIDARGRPLPFKTNQEEQNKLNREWLWRMGAME